MGYVLNLPPRAPADPALIMFFSRLSLEYATLRSNYRESLSEFLILELCNRLSADTKCPKSAFRKVQGSIMITFTGAANASLTVVISPDGYRNNTTRPCPSCGETYNGRQLGGLGWTNAHNIINHGKIGAAILLAIDDTLKVGSVSDPRLTAGAADVGFVITQVRGKAEGYGGPAVTFGSGEQCPVCEKIHASDCLIQRHRRCLLHVQSGNTYRAINIAGTVYIRGNEAIVGMQFGATRNRPQGDLNRLTILTHAMAGKIAAAALETLQEFYDKQEAQANQVFLMDLLLASDKLTWAIRKRLIEAAESALGPLPPHSAQTAVVNPVIPAATVPPQLPALPMGVAPAAVSPTPPVAVVVPVVPLVVNAVPMDPPQPPDQPAPTLPSSSAARNFAMYIGSLKQRVLRAPYPTYGIDRIKRARGYRAELVPDLANYPDANQQLQYMLDQFWKAFRANQLARPVFEVLLREFELIAFEKRRGSRVEELKRQLMMK